MLVWRYYLLFRPPFVGTHPTGGEVSRHVFERIQEVPEIGRRAHGWVEYDRELPADQVDHFDMVLDPQSPEEAENPWDHQPPYQPSLI